MKPEQDETPVVAKPQLGTKRTCASCGTKFYDFGRTPIVCPKCSTVYQPPVERVSPQPAPAKPVPVPVKKAPAKEKPEIVSLEEAEKEQAPAKRAGEAVEEDKFEIEDEALDTDDDDTFLEDDEEEDDDVTGLLGGGIDAGNDET
ncbi:MAG: TIGR02300 family protein [Hyphomicrobiales bacterium]|nr:TIGR02300 family protein [Hyphomicrobiales bacterium]